MSAALDNRYRMLMENVLHTNIEQYFDITYNNDNEKVMFSLSKEDMILIFQIDYYNDDSDIHIQLKTQIVFTDRYPFTAPVWKLQHVTINDDTSVKLTRHYEEIVQYHNKQYYEDWSSVIYVEKDILDFIVKVVDFRQIYE